MKKITHTCISAIKLRDGRIMMAGDRRCSWGWGFAAECPEPKVIKKNGFLLGGTGDSDFLELILDAFEPDQEGELKTYLHFKFKRDVAKFLKQQGYRDEHDLLRLPAEADCEILLAKENKLFVVTFRPGELERPLPEPSIISIGEVKPPFAVGCGAASALPILLAKLKEVSYNTKEHLRLAMQTAADISPGCDGRVDFISE